jgi:hypothetical protein
LLEATKATFVFATFIVINANEITTIDNVQWLSIHLYVMEEASNFALCWSNWGFQNTLQGICK